MTSSASSAKIRGDQLALVRLARHDRPGLDGRLALVEPQVGLAARRCPARGRRSSSRPGSAGCRGCTQFALPPRSPRPNRGRVRRRAGSRRKASSAFPERGVFDGRQACRPVGSRYTPVYATGPPAATKKRSDEAFSQGATCENDFYTRWSIAASWPFRRAERTQLPIIAPRIPPQWHSSTASRYCYCSGCGAKLPRCHFHKQMPNHPPLRSDRGAKRTGGALS